MTTFDEINAERRKRRIRELTLPEYEQGRARHSRMAAPGVDVTTWLLGYALVASLIDTQPLPSASALPEPSTAPDPGGGTFGGAGASGDWQTPASAPSSFDSSPSPSFDSSPAPSVDTSSFGG